MLWNASRFTFQTNQYAVDVFSVKRSVNVILLTGKRRLRKRGTNKTTLVLPYIIREEQEKLNGHFKALKEEKRQLRRSRRKSTVLLLGTKQQNRSAPQCQV